MWTRTGEPSAGMITSRSARPPAVTSTAVSSTGVGSLRSVPSTAMSRNGAPATHADIGPLSVLMTRTRARLPGARLDGDVALAAVDGAHPVVEVSERHDIPRRPGRPRAHHEGAEQAAADLFVRDLVRVVPEGADLVGDESVREVLADPDRVLGDARRRRPWHWARPGRASAA